MASRKKQNYLPEIRTGGNPNKTIHLILIDWVERTWDLFLYLIIFVPIKRFLLLNYCFTSLLTKRTVIGQIWFSFAGSRSLSFMSTFSSKSEQLFYLSLRCPLLWLQKILNYFNVYTEATSCFCFGVSSKERSLTTADP